MGESHRRPETEGGRRQFPSQVEHTGDIRGVGSQSAAAEPGSVRTYLHHREHPVPHRARQHTQIESEFICLKSH